MQTDTLTKETILSDDIMLEIFDEKDLIHRQRLIDKLSDRAAELGVKGKFEKYIQLYQKEEDRLLKAQEIVQEVPPQQKENKTAFGEKYPQLRCGNWIADNQGVRTIGMYGEAQACYHPILPIERLVNLETGLEKIVLAFKKGRQWKEITVNKEQIATNTKIVALSNYGISVTSENSRMMVKYLADVENMNLDIIPERYSTTKMGWIDNQFMPFTEEVLYDGDGKFDDIYNTLKSHGSFDEWLKLILYYREKGRTELKFFMAASFASVLVKPLNALPFWCNIWGGTGIGKTVAEMMAVSIWADPTGSKYIADFQTTATAAEVRLDFLNNLPMVIDDTASLKRKMGDNFSSMIYDLCSGKGKSRSNRNLGITRERVWKNVIFSSGETPLSNENLQGGAMNRVLDLEAGSTPIFENGQAVVDTLSEHYGFAGQEFLKIINSMGVEKIKEIQQSILEELKAKGKMEKQCVSLSILLTADKIATDYIFKDGQYLNQDDIESVLLDPNAVSENERCYEYILGEVAINPNKFNTNDFGNYQNEMWGEKEDGYIIILYNVFEKMCKNGGFSPKAFLSWAKEKGLLKSEPGKNYNRKMIGGSRFKCIYLRMKYEPIEVEENTPPF